MAGVSITGPGAIRVLPGTVELNGPPPSFGPDAL